MKQYTITRILTRSYDVVQSIDMTEHELQTLCKIQGVDNPDQLLDGDWTEIWISLEDQDEFSDRVYDPNADTWYGNYDYQDEVSDYEFTEKEEENNE